MIVHITINSKTVGRALQTTAAFGAVIVGVFVTIPTGSWPSMMNNYHGFFVDSSYFIFLTFFIMLLVGSLLTLIKVKDNNSLLEEINNNEKPDYYNEYTILDIPDERKSLFQDILKGFEDFALLKGYKVSISIDSSIPNKIAFKFTIIEFNEQKTNENLKDDLNEYINKIKKGHDFEDLIGSFSTVEQRHIIMALKNRISFLQQNYEVKKNINKFYDSFFDKISHNNMQQNPLVQVHQHGNTMDKKTYISENSKNVSQGENNSNQYSYVSINLGKNFSEKKELIDKIKYLVSELEKYDGGNYNKIIRKLNSVKDELEDEANPDKKSIHKWLTKAKGMFESIKVAEKVYSHAKDLFDAFGI